MFETFFHQTALKTPLQVSSVNIIYIMCNCTVLGSGYHVHKRGSFIIVFAQKIFKYIENNHIVQFTNYFLTIILCKLKYPEHVTKFTIGLLLNWQYQPSMIMKLIRFVTQNNACLYNKIFYKTIIFLLATNM